MKNVFFFYLAFTTLAFADRPCTDTDTMAKVRSGEILVSDDLSVNGSTFDQSLVKSGGELEVIPDGHGCMDYNFSRFASIWAVGKSLLDKSYTIDDVTISGYSVYLNFKSPRTGHLQFTRAGLDYRKPGKMTVGSLKYNLGEYIQVKLNCRD